MGRLGDIIAAHGNAYLERFADRMSLDQVQAMRAIERCHTAAAGEALWRCPDCGKRHFTFLGCGNRHCPSCGGTRAEQWLRKQSALLLPEVTYHLVTFTLPSQLRHVVRSHPRECLDVLMRLSASTLLDVAANDHWLGAVPGLTAVLHTWGRQLQYHPHVHFIATGGGLNARGQWIEAQPKFLVPVHALSDVFRARFRDTLRNDHPHLFAAIHPKVWRRRKKWGVHSKPVGAGQTALAYLARYVYRVAISERAITQHDDGRIVVRYTDSITKRVGFLRLGPQEFLRRFLQHVLPKGFRKVRYFGFHHSSKRPVLRTLQAAMALTAGVPLPQPAPEEPTERPLCSVCSTPMVFEKRMSALKRALYFPGTTPARGPP